MANDNDKPDEDQGQDQDQEAMAADWESAMSEQEQAEGDNGNAGAESEDASSGRVGLEELTEDEEPNTNPDLDVILDIPVSISMEVGRTSITIRNLLQLNQGSVIELDRLAGEPLDVLVNGTLIAHGEVVVVNEKFGIRMTDVISPAERIKKLH